MGKRKGLQSLTWQIKHKERNMRAIVVFSLLFMKCGKKINLNYSITFSICFSAALQGYKMENT